MTDVDIRAELQIDNINELDNLHREINDDIFSEEKKQEYINQIVAIRNVREEYADEIKQLDEGEDADVNEIYTDLNEQILQIDKLSDLDTENQGEFLIEMDEAV